jgi:hypothetical protein
LVISGASMLAFALAGLAFAAPDVPTVPVLVCTEAL